MMGKNVFLGFFVFCFFFVGINSCFIFSEDKETPQFEMS